MRRNRSLPPLLRQRVRERLRCRRTRCRRTTPDWGASWRRRQACEEFPRRSCYRRRPRARTQRRGLATADVLSVRSRTRTTPRQERFRSRRLVAQESATRIKALLRAGGRGDFELRFVPVILVHDRAPHELHDAGECETPDEDQESAEEKRVETHPDPIVKVRAHAAIRLAA